jgi:hypothetical protein
MKTNNYILFFLALSFTQVSAVNDSNIIINAKLLKICNKPDSGSGHICPGCGTFQFGTVCEYDSAKNLNGKLNSGNIFVVIPCIEIPRPEYSINSGNLNKFVVGNLHSLILTKSPISNLHICNECDIPKGYSLFYCIKADSIKIKSIFKKKAKMP